MLPLPRCLAHHLTRQRYVGLIVHDSAFGRSVAVLRLFSLRSNGSDLLSCNIPEIGILEVFLEYMSVGGEKELADTKLTL